MLVYQDLELLDDDCQRIFGEKDLDFLLSLGLFISFFGQDRESKWQQ